MKRDDYPLMDFKSLYEVKEFECWFEGQKVVNMASVMERLHNDLINKYGIDQLPSLAMLYQLGKIRRLINKQAMVITKRERKDLLISAIKEVQRVLPMIEAEWTVTFNFEKNTDADIDDIEMTFNSDVFPFDVGSYLQAHAQQKQAQMQQAAGRVRQNPGNGGQQGPQLVSGN